MQGWMKVKAAAQYADVGERTFYNWIKQGLRHVRVRGTIRVKPEWVDEFLQGHEVNLDQVGQLVDEVCKELGL